MDDDTHNLSAQEGPANSLPSVSSRCVVGRLGGWRRRILDVDRLESSFGFGFLSRDFDCQRVDEIGRSAASRRQRDDEKESYLPILEARRGT